MEEVLQWGRIGDYLLAMSESDILDSELFSASTLVAVGESVFSDAEEIIEGHIGKVAHGLC